MRPNQQVQYVLPDGRLTLQGMQLLEAQAREIATLKSLATGLQSQIDALDVRVTALEP